MTNNTNFDLSTGLGRRGGVAVLRHSVLAIGVLSSLAVPQPAVVSAVPSVPGVAAVEVVPAAAAANGDAQNAIGGQVPEVMSEELTYTRWAHPRTVAPIRLAPLASAPRVGALHMLTEDGDPEVYLLLSRVTTATGVTWMQLRLPGRPNGRLGWVRAADLGAVHLTRWALRIDLARLRATLSYSGDVTWSAPIGVGAPRTPTPTGHYWVRELLRVPGDTLYGPYAFGTSDYSVLSEWPEGGVVGIHGTNEPQLIPGHPSHGCIRLRNADIMYLAKHLPVGAPVDVVG